MVRQLNGHSGDVLAVAFSPDGRTLLAGYVGGSGGTACVWRVATGELLRQLDGGGAVSAVAFSPDGQWAATGCYGGDTAVRLWATDSWDVVRTLQCGSNVWGVLFTPDSQTVVAEATEDISVWDVATRRRQLTVPGGTGGCGTCLSTTPLGDRLAASGLMTARVFDSSSLVDVARIPAAVLARAPASAWSRVPAEVVERLPAAGKACLPMEVLRHVRGEMRVGIAGALSEEAVGLLAVIRPRWLPRLPLGVLHRLPPSDRSACIAFLGAR